MTDELAFSSKIDLWLLILVLTAVTVCLWALGANWNDILARGWLVTALIVIPLGIGIVLPLWFIASLRYFLSDTELRVRCGPLHWRIPVAEIREISRTRDPATSPAMSFDRVHIVYGEDRDIMISPEPREEFLRQLEHRRKQAQAA